MSQVEHYSTALRYRTGGGSVELHDRLVRARETAGGRATRSRAACSKRPRTCAASTGYRARSRTSWHTGRT
jgi:hypothetical protein